MSGGIFFQHLGSHDEYSKVNRFNPHPVPTIVKVVNPDKYELMAKIADPNYTYLACETHGTSRGIKVNDYKWLFDYRIEELMRGRPPFRLVILSSCSTGIGELPTLFSKGDFSNSVVIAPISTTYTSYSHELGQWLEASSDEPEQTLLHHWQDIMLTDGGTPKTPLRFFGSDSLRSSDIFQPITRPQLKYRTHVQNVGWQDWVNEGETAGTVGRSLRIEAIEIIQD